MRNLRVTKRITSAGRVFLYLEPEDDFYRWLSKIAVLVSIVEAVALVYVCMI